MWTPACCEICKIIPLASTKGVKFGHLRAPSCGLGNLHLQARKCLKNVTLTTNRNLGFLHIFVITGGRETKYGSFWSNPWIPARDVTCEGSEVSPKSESALMSSCETSPPLQHIALCFCDCISRCLCICICIHRRRLSVWHVHIYCMGCWGTFVLNVILTRRGRVD